MKCNGGLHATSALCGHAGPVTFANRGKSDQKRLPLLPACFLQCSRCAGRVNGARLLRYRYAECVPTTRLRPRNTARFGADKGAEVVLSSCVVCGDCFRNCRQATHYFFFHRSGIARKGIPVILAGYGISQYFSSSSSQESNTSKHEHRSPLCIAARVDLLDENRKSCLPITPELINRCALQYACKRYMRIRHY